MSALSLLTPCREQFQKEHCIFCLLAGITSEKGYLLLRLVTALKNQHLCRKEETTPSPPKKTNNKPQKPKE